MQLRINAGPVVRVRRRPDQRVQLGQPVQDPAFQFRHGLQRHRLGLGEPIQAAQHPAQRIAQAAVEFRLLFQDFRTDAQILGGVRGHDPKPEDIGTVFIADLIRGDRIAQGFGHLAALFVVDEAMRQDCLERRHPARAHRLQQ